MANNAAAYIVAGKPPSEYILQHRFKPLIWQDKKWVDEVHSYGAFDYPQAKFEDLGNEVHPLFKPMIVQPGWRPALQLASKYLQEPTFLPFWHSLLCTDHTLLTAHSDAVGVPVYQLEESVGGLTDSEEAETRQALIDASRHVFWACEPRQEQEGAITPANIKKDKNLVFGSQHGCTLPIPRNHPAFDFPPDNSYPVGSPTITTIAYFYAHVLRPESTWSVEERLRASLLLSRTLLHEVTHALYMIRFPSVLCNPHKQNIALYVQEPFLHTQREIELGMAMESFLFDAIFEFTRTTRPKGDFILYGWKWPDINWVTKSLTTKGLMYLGRGRPQKWMTKYVIDMDFVQSHFTKEFWERDVKNLGFKAFKFSKKLGLRQYNVHWKEGDEEYDSDNSSIGRGDDDDFVVRDGQTPRAKDLLPLGRELQRKDAWPHVHQVLDDAQAQQVTLVDASSENTWQPYPGPGEEPQTRFWHFPVSFTTDDQGKVIVDDTQTTPWDLCDRYLPMLE